MQQDAVPLPGFGQGEGPVVPQIFIDGNGPADARKARFDAVGDKDPSVGLPERFAGFADGVVPQAVEVHPVGALHQGPGIFRQGCGRVDLVGPGGTDVVAGGLPGLCRGGKGGNQQE